METPDQKYLILGASRGGTTILAAALGSHPSVAILDEEQTGALNRLTGNKIAGVKLCVPNQVELDRRWNPVFSPGLSCGFFRKSMFMSKMPKSRLSIRDYDAFGEIRHICILRHPAGVIPSIVKRERRSSKVACYRWQRCIEVFADLDRDARYDPIFISFERLVSEPERTLRRLSEALGLEFSECMLGAPSNNVRYQSQGFDAAKAEYENADQIWDQLPKELKGLYTDLCEKSL